MTNSGIGKGGDYNDAQELKQFIDECLKCGAKRIDNQLGLEKTPEEYIENTVTWAWEVRRVLRKDGTFWLNLGDSMSGGGRGGDPKHLKGDNSAAATMESYKGIPAKNLMGMPWKVAFALQEAGWYLRSAMPWVKRSAMPESCTDRPASALEYMFLLTKSSKYYFDMDAIRKGVTGNAHAGRKDQELSPRYGANDMDGHNQRNGTWKQSYLPSSRNFRNTDLFYQSLEEPHGMIFCGEEMVGLDVNPQAYSEAHFATFPEKLVEPCIKAGSSEKGACPECGAPWVRIFELSKEYAKMIKNFRVTDFDGLQIGAYIKVGLDKAGLSQSQLAEYFPSVTGGKTGCAHNWITGKNIPTAEQWKVIKDVLSLGNDFDLLLENPATSEEIGFQPDDVGFGVKRQKPDHPSQVPLKSKTIGWQPTCSHKAEPVPCVVLDPFGGSGTVKNVADRLGRRGVMCELKMEYIEMAKKRCHQLPSLF